MSTELETLQAIVDLSHKAQLSGTDRDGLMLALINIELAAQTEIDCANSVVIVFPNTIERPCDSESM